MMSNNNVVLMTGFGPFRGHTINASWEAVQLVPSHSIDNTDIIIEEIPVIYNVVDTRIPQLWERYNPIVSIKFYT